MPLPNKIVSSLSSIRTHSGTPDGSLLPYKAYMVVTTLEMERFRREAERAKLLTRFEFIKSRLQYIETEKAEILRRLAHRSELSSHREAKVTTQRCSGSHPRRVQNEVLKK